MSLLYYRLEKGLVVHLEEGTALPKGGYQRERKRSLYGDTLKSLAKKEDVPLVTELMRIRRSGGGSLDTLTYDSISIPARLAPQILKLLAATMRLYVGGERIEWGGNASLKWRAEELTQQSIRVEGRLIPGGDLQGAKLILPGAVVTSGKLWLVEEELSLLEAAAKGPFVLEGGGKKRFLEREVEWVKTPVVETKRVSQLRLLDPFACFIRLIEGDPLDLIEAGYSKRGSDFVCPTDRAKEALGLLFAVGWEVEDFQGRKVVRETGRAFQVDGEGLKGVVRFGSHEIPLQRAREGLVELGAGVMGWVEKPLLPDVGEWVGNRFRVRVGQLPRLLEVPNIDWDPAFRQSAERLSGKGLEQAIPSPSFRGTLLPYQQKGVDWLWFLYQGGFGALLADEMGLGKTVQTAAFFSRLPPDCPILVVAPTSLLFNWRAEIRKFLGERPVTLVSYARLRLDVQTLAQTKWEVVVLDESHVIKNRETQVAQAARSLPAKFRICLTGTPIENRPEELASQFQFLMPGHIRDTVGMKEQIKPFLLRRKKQEVGLELPPKREQIIWLEMGEAQRQLYEEMKHRARPLVEEGKPLQILEAILRLRQVCVDPRLVDPTAERGVKAEQLELDLKGDEGAWLIFSQFTTALQLFRREWSDSLYLDGSMGAEARAEEVRRFQEGAERLFFLSLKAGGVGLNLTVADRVLLLDPWWHEGVEMQAIDRAHRIGQTKPLQVVRYLIADSIEERMHELKKRKQFMAQELLDEPIASLSSEDWLHLLS